MFAGANPLGLNLRPDDDFEGLFDTGAESNKTARCSNFLASSSSLLSFKREVADEDGVEVGRIAYFVCTSPTCTR